MSLASIWFVRARESAKWIASLAPRADQPPKDVHDPFASMKPVKLGNHNMLNNRPSELIHTFVTDLSF